MPRRWLAARTIARRPASAPAHASSSTPGCPVLRGCVWGGARPHCPSQHALRPPPPRVCLVPTP
eukprot:4678568-Prymnesium_polylepis.1